MHPPFFHPSHFSYTKLQSALLSTHNSNSKMPATAYPPFPDDVPTVPLLIIDYALIKAGDEKEIDRLWEAATQLGFW